MTKVDRMRALLAAGDRDGAVMLAHKLLTCHGHETAEDARDAFMKYGAGHYTILAVWNEAFEVVNPRHG